MATDHVICCADSVHDGVGAHDVDSAAELHLSQDSHIFLGTQFGHLLLPLQRLLPTSLQEIGSRRCRRQAGQRNPKERSAQKWNSKERKPNFHFRVLLSRFKAGLVYMLSDYHCCFNLKS